MWSSVITITSSAIASPIAPVFPLIADNQPTGLIDDAHWYVDTDSNLQYRPITTDLSAALPTTTGATVYVSNGEAFISDAFGCNESPLNISGFITQLSPDTMGFAWLMLVKHEDNWFIHQSTNSGQSWVAIRQFSASSASLATTEMGWAILKQTEIGWTIEHTSASGGAPTTEGISLAGELDLLDASNNQALIQAHNIITPPVHGGTPYLSSDLYLWEQSEGLTLLASRTDGLKWITGVVDHSHGIYTLDESGKAVNHINGFEVEQGQASCLWKTSSYDSLWLCQPPNTEEDDYRIWQTDDGIQWMGWLQDVADLENCQTSDTTNSTPPNKGCSVMRNSPHLLWVAFVLGLTRSRFYDN